MKKVRSIHFWIGIIATVFLLMESITGIIMYFEEGKKGEGIERPAAMEFSNPPSTNAGNTASIDASNFTSRNDSDTSADASQNNVGNTTPPVFNGEQGNFPDKAGGALSVKNLHTGIFGLISGISMFILTATGLVMSIIILKAKSRRKKRDQINQTA